MPVSDTNPDSKRAVAVVGCNGAIGSAVVDGLLDSGISVLGFDFQDAPLRSGLASYRCLDYSALHTGLDVFTEILRAHPLPVTGLAVSTGLFPARLMHTETEDTLTALFHANAIAPALVTSAFIAATEPGPRSVVVASSLAARRSRIGTGAYSATKVALERLVSTQALEHRDEGVRINMVQPGYVASDSDINRVPAAYERSIAESSGLVRPADLVDSFLWLLGPASAMVNGETISVDAGNHLGRKDEIAWVSDAD